MFTFHNVCSVPSSFRLTGIPELHIWLSIPFGSMYLVAVVGNVTILAVVRVEHSLHQPMYFFLCMLAAIDLVLSTSTMPKLLGIFWFGAGDIGLDACLGQMFLIHCFATVESGIFPWLLIHGAHSYSGGSLGLVSLLQGVLHIGPLPLMIRLCIGFLVLILDTLAMLAVMGLATPEARLKTLGTCTSHIFHTLLANFYLLIPPILNPIVYAVHTKQI
uniref:G-protein coupled receptors family 1 profile domain-containing protein n=1 Tax=Nomascus leucogenys TaxID=61853 RepID=A0A2I3GB53_NOMLE